MVHKTLHSWRIAQQAKKRKKHKKVVKLILLIFSGIAACLILFVVPKAFVTEELKAVAEELFRIIEILNAESVVADVNASFSKRLFEIIERKV